jgi:hypothetical protein
MATSHDRGRERSLGGRRNAAQGADALSVSETTATSQADTAAASALKRTPGGAWRSAADEGTSAMPPLELTPRNSSREPSAGVTHELDGDAVCRRDEAAQPPRHLLAHRWLSDVQSLGGAAEMQLLGNGDDVANMTKLHRDDRVFKSALVGRTERARPWSA